MTAISVSTPRLRLTQRGRAVFTTLVAGPLAVLALVTVLNGGIATATSDLAKGTFDYVTVESGQSLWQLAESIAPNADPRDVISDIVRLNQLESSVVHPGERLAVPPAYSR
ncbi:MAG: LysM peptidoglycan-binding domain-containing protein [Terrimesophilobacter sp.]